jgi:hypothetical protein
MVRGVFLLTVCYFSSECLYENTRTDEESLMGHLNPVNDFANQFDCVDHGQRETTVFLEDSGSPWHDQNDRKVICQFVVRHPRLFAFLLAPYNAHLQSLHPLPSFFPFYRARPYLWFEVYLAPVPVQSSCLGVYDDLCRMYRGSCDVCDSLCPCLYEIFLYYHDGSHGVFVFRENEICGSVWCDECRQKHYYEVSASVLR